MIKNNYMKWLIGIITVFLIVDIVASFFFYNLAIARNDKEFLQGNADLEVSDEAMKEFTSGNWRDWVREQDFETIEMNAYDDIKLNGYYLEAKEPSNKIVVMAHGYLGNAKQMGLYGEYYYEELGYNFFTPDLRGHGKSEGDYIGFGWHDRIDIIDWMNLLIDRFGPDTEIVMHGISMGAATVLMASGEELPENVKAIIADSPYTSVHDLFAYQMKRMFHLPSFPVLQSTSLVAKAKAGYSLTEASALKQVEKSEVPILYIHGNADEFVPTKMTNKLYENTKSKTEMLTIEGASHGEGFVIERELYIDKMNEFIEKYIE